MMFEEESYFGLEDDGQIVANIIRKGDTSHKSTVRCYTRQNSAKVDIDFYERPDTDDSIIKFEAGIFILLLYSVSVIVVPALLIVMQIVILYN